MKIYKLNRFLHRDLGYLFVGMIIVYALSGIALNHKNDFNPNYIITKEKIKTDNYASKELISKAEALKILERLDEKGSYKKHYFPKKNFVKIFIHSGSVYINYKTGEGIIEKIKKRPVFFEVNFLHYNPGKLWVWFSDIFCIALILLAISGLFILKVKNGIKGRGAWLTSIGIIIPVIFLILYL